MKYPIVIYPCEEGSFVAEIPALKGCLAQGETLEETLQELITVRTLWLETAQKHGHKLPDEGKAIALSKSIKCDRLAISEKIASLRLTRHVI